MRQTRTGPTTVAEMKSPLTMHNRRFPREVFSALLLLTSLTAHLDQVVAKSSDEATLRPRRGALRLVAVLVCTASESCLYSPLATSMIFQPLLVVLIIRSCPSYLAPNSTSPQIVCVLYSPALRLAPRLFPRVALSCLSCSKLVVWTIISATRRQLKLMLFDSDISSYPFGLPKSLI